MRKYLEYIQLIVSIIIGFIISIILAILYILYNNSNNNHIVINDNILETNVYSSNVCQRLQIKSYIPSNDQLYNNDIESRYTYENLILSKFMSQCHLENINIANIQLNETSLGTSYLWISFIGDSLLRSPFLLLASQLSGSNRTNLENDEYSYNLGNRYHYKDLFKSKYNEWSASETMKLHLDHVICCPIGYHISKSCTIAIKEHDYTISTIEYLKSQIVNEFNEKAICLSWSFQPLLTLFETYITSTYFNESLLNQNLISSKQLLPKVIILNIGLHEIFNNGNHVDYKLSSSEQKLKTTKKLIEKLYYRKNISFMYHKPLPMNKDFIIINDNLVSYNNLLDQYLLKSSILKNSYIDLFNIAVLLHEDSYCAKGDGIHFKRNCVYAPFITQWDLNILKLTNVIL